MEKQLSKLGKKKLLEICASLGIKANQKDTIKVLVTWILEETEDLNVWLQAKANVKKDGVAKKVTKSGKVYAGKCVKTGEPIYK